MPEDVRMHSERTEKVVFNGKPLLRMSYKTVWHLAEQVEVWPDHEGDQGATNLIAGMGDML